MSSASRFIMPIGECSAMVDTILGELEKDPVHLQFSSFYFIPSGLLLLNTVVSVLLVVPCPSPLPC